MTKAILKRNSLSHKSERTARKIHFVKSKDFSLNYPNEEKTQTTTTTRKKTENLQYFLFLLCIFLLKDDVKRKSCTMFVQFLTCEAHQVLQALKYFIRTNERKFAFISKWQRHEEHERHETIKRDFDEGDVYVLGCEMREGENG